MAAWSYKDHMHTFIALILTDDRFAADISDGGGGGGRGGGGGAGGGATDICTGSNAFALLSLQQLCSRKSITKYAVTTGGSL